MNRNTNRALKGTSTHSNKENMHPNLVHLYKYKPSPETNSREIREPRVSGFSLSEEKEWRRKVLLPSEGEQRIEDRLSKMLDGQRGVLRDSLPTTLSVDKPPQPSFVSSANVTLQKYFGENSLPESRQSMRDDLIKIMSLVHKAFECKPVALKSASEQQIIEAIKGSLEPIVHEQ